MKMKAAILNAYQQPLSIEEVEIDPPKADEVLVKIAAAGICHSDYHLMKGEWQFGVPQILGHEASGIVAEVGPGVMGLKPDNVGQIAHRVRRRLAERIKTDARLAPLRDLRWFAA